MTAVLTDDDIERIADYINEIRQSRKEPEPAIDKYCIKTVGEQELGSLPIRLHCEEFQKEEVKGVGV